MAKSFQIDGQKVLCYDQVNYSATNISVGYQAGNSLTTGTGNVFVGRDCGPLISTGAHNVLIGNGVTTATNQSYTVAIGSLVDGGVGSVAIGYTADTSLSNYSIGIGYDAVTNGSGSPIAIGQACYATNSGISIGINSGTNQKNGTCSSNYLIGAYVGYNMGINATTATDNIAIGSQALYGGSATLGTGRYNTAIGTSSQYYNQGTTANHNVAMGYAAMQYNTLGDANVALGNYALRGGTNTGASVGTGNVAIGYQACSSLGDIDYTVAIGGYALLNCTTGSLNTVIGGVACRYLTTGIRNVAMGYSALGATTFNGSNITAIGYAAGNIITTGGNCVVVGYNAQPSAATTTNEVVIGYGVTGTAANQIALGYSTNKTYITAGGTTWSGTSDERIKKNIQQTSIGLDFIKLINPVKFQYRPSYDIPQELYNHYREENDKDTETIFDGLIAQNVQQAMEQCGIDKFDGLTHESDGAMGVSIGIFVLPLINAVKELSSKLDNLQSEFDKYKETHP